MSARAKEFALWLCVKSEPDWSKPAREVMPFANSYCEDCGREEVVKPPTGDTVKPVRSRPVAAKVCPAGTVARQTWLMLPSGSVTRVGVRAVFGSVGEPSALKPTLPEAAKAPR